MVRLKRPGKGIKGQEGEEWPGEGRKSQEGEGWPGGGRKRQEGTPGVGSLKWPGRVYLKIPKMDSLKNPKWNAEIFPKRMPGHLKKDAQVA